VSSGGGSGCVVAGAAVDTKIAGPDDEGLITVVRDTFRSWIALLTSQLEAVGIAADRAGASSDDPCGHGGRTPPVPRGGQRPTTGNGSRATDATTSESVTLPER
jgi:hypothetical protein